MPDEMPWARRRQHAVTPGWPTSLTEADDTAGSLTGCVQDSGLQSRWAQISTRGAMGSKCRPCEAAAGEAAEPAGIPRGWMVRNVQQNDEL